MKFEICTDSVAGVRAARESGADRVELCSSLFEGGLTPSAGMMRQARLIGGIGVHVMIRSRGGDFLYDDDDFAVMLDDIEMAKQAGADGVVFGCLQAGGEIDVARTDRLIRAARPMSVTFHRAFDMTADPIEALRSLIDLGVDRVLTSGLGETALDGLPQIVDLIQQFGDRIVIMPGGGITARNVARIVAAAQPAELHFAALQLAPSGMRFRRDAVFMGGELRQAEYAVNRTDGTLVRRIMAAAKG